MDSHPLTEQDIDNIITNIRNDPTHGERQSAYRFTTSSGDTKFVMGVALLGNLTLKRNSANQYVFDAFEELSQADLIRGMMPMIYDLMVQKYAGKAWLKNSMAAAEGTA